MCVNTLCQLRSVCANTNVFLNVIDQNWLNSVKVAEEKLNYYVLAAVLKPTQVG